MGIPGDTGQNGDTGALSAAVETSASFVMGPLNAPLHACENLRMDQRLSFVTLAVRDLAKSREFYVDGLGWQPELEAPGEVIMFRVGAQVMLSLWDVHHFEAEVGAVSFTGGVLPVTLAHNVEHPAQVDAILELAARCGASVESARSRTWGGYSGYFADPDGYRWEIAVNPSALGSTLLPGDRPDSQ